MSHDSNQLLPLENWLQEKSTDFNLFPSGGQNHFKRYQLIKVWLEDNVYKWIGSGTSAVDQGVYTDHSIDHFNAVIKYAGYLLGLTAKKIKENNFKDEIDISPYEVFILLVSILLHDAGNIYGRRGHEKKPTTIFMEMGNALCPDRFEAVFIGKIAQAHGGKVKNTKGQESKDTIRNLKLDGEESYHSITYRPGLIAALVRFADEICEDRTRAARFMMSQKILPVESEMYHFYASAVSSVDVDLKSKFISIKYELDKGDVIDRINKDGSKEFLIDEISSRLEKMYCELLYCKAFMYEVVPINKIRATVIIYDDHEEIESSFFELAEKDYPENPFSFRKLYPDWSGENVKQRLVNKENSIAHESICNQNA